jgi:hypothetical protein
VVGCVVTAPRAIENIVVNSAIRIVTRIRGLLRKRLMGPPLGQARKAPQ